MIFRFADCTLDTARQSFMRGGEERHLEPQVFAFIAELARAEGAVVSKDHLIETVWQGLTVSEATISARVNAARTALGDTGKDQRMIRTVPKRGFQLVPEVVTDVAKVPETAIESMAPAVRFATARDGALIAHAHNGSGPPLMRASHWLSHLELDWHCPVWQPFLTRLGADFTLHRYDQRGTGLTSRDLDNTDIDDFISDLRAVADAAGLTRFPIFAASQGVPVAIRFAALCPERVSRLVLYGGSAKGRALRPAMPGGLDEETMLGLIRTGWGREDSPVFRALTGAFMPDATPDQVTSFARIQNASISPENATVLRAAVDRFDVTGDLAQVRAPTLVIHARADAIHPIDQGRQIAAAIPDARFMMLDSRNHVPLPQDPAWEHMMQAVGRFCLDAP